MKDDFRDLMLAEIPRLRASALALTGSAVEADDLVQDTLVRAWRFRERYLPGTNLAAWMFRILKNAFLTQRTGRRSWVEDVDGQYSSQIALAPEQEWRVQFAEVLHALPQLPDDNRDAVLLVGALGMSYQEAADACGCDIGVLRGRVHRGRAQLADLTGLQDRRASRQPDASAVRLVQ
ncbi:MAG TPA: sigma-70 family RNA polymerase sigma factor [Phenylobacterium sp.]|jgi:RNA polymerase sigma-70 factor (ECF subfamily)|nr:sigma-70 family RNA polymerase sigma factor [Phenylobacterium sp.]